MRDGSKPNVAQLLKSDEDQPFQALAVVDADPEAWGAWRTDGETSFAVRASDMLRLDWNEMSSVGWGGEGVAQYSYLPPGQYHFRVRAVTELGEGTGETLSIPIRVAPPFWQTSWFRGAVLVCLMGALLAVVRYITWRKMQAKLELLDQQRAVALERTRIARRDIHDDFGG